MNLRAIAAIAATGAALAVGLPLAVAAPASDGGGYVNGQVLHVEGGWVPAG